jgi:Ti-type conjugative transfer relaxase TraA
MAIYHFSAQMISRSQGRSSVAASAYRSAERLVDERTGLVHDYTRKQDVVDRVVLLPEGAPSEYADREVLWNAVEASEKRKDAQLAREINVALPRELSADENWALLTDFVQSTFVAAGMIADVAFHRGHVGGEDQPHGHVMLTTRSVSEVGFGAKRRDWNDRALLCDWREQWAVVCNRELNRLGFVERIDHRTLEAQGIDLEPQSKIGPKASSLAMARFEEHQALARRNGERLLANPEIALTALTRQQSTFSQQDVARFVNRHTVDADQFMAVSSAIFQHPDLVSLRSDVSDTARYSTRSLVALEAQLLDQVVMGAETDRHAVSSSVVDRVLVDRGLSEEQTQALRSITEGADVSCVVGFAGTGKSYLLGAAREVWESQGYRVQGMTLSGIAAENLEGGSGIQSGTVASRLWHWDRDRERLGPKDVVVLDEAGMLGSRQMARVMNEARGVGAKVVLVGDPEQLQAIDAGGAYRAITERIGFQSMVEVRRQQVDWQQQATRDFGQQRTAEGLAAYEAHRYVQTFLTHSGAMHSLVEQWDEWRSEMPDQSHLMLAYTRADVADLNAYARELRHRQGELGPDVMLPVRGGEQPFAAGDQIYFLRNESQVLGVKNGTLGVIEKIDDYDLTVRLGGLSDSPEACRRVTFNIDTYNAIAPGYAATVYKAQGVTVDRSYILASQYFDRHSTYVAMSRHRISASLFVDREQFPSFADLTRTLSRARIKDMTVDYTQGNRLCELKDVKNLGKTAEKVTEKSLDRLWEGGYSPPQSSENLVKQRALDRQYEKLLQAEVSALEKETGLSYSVHLREGDQGIYQGIIEVAGSYYGVMKQEGDKAKLIPARDLASREKGKMMEIKKQGHYRGKNLYKGIQVGVRGKEQEIGLDIDF